MATPAYQIIYDQVLSGSYHKTLAISVSQAQKAKLALANPTAAEIAWSKRDPTDEARRIIFYVLGTAPIVTKLDQPQTITDADFDNALAAVLPSLLKAVL